MSEKFPARLVGTTGEIYELKTPAVGLGRAADNQIVIVSDKASRYHAQVNYLDGQYFIQDLKSKNGTRVNGLPLETQQALQHGDRISLADAHFIFEAAGFNPDAETETYSAADLSRPEAARVVPALQLDEAAMEVKLNGQPVNPPLSLLEWKLLVVLFQQQGKVCSREMIIEAVYQPANPESIPFDTAIETLVSRLRKHLQMNDPAQLPAIKTIRGVGYRLEL
jgi:hypothetical protein